MTRLSNLLKTFRTRTTRRVQQLVHADSTAPFEAFCNEAQEKSPQTKESSLNGDLSSSPLKQRTDEDYVRFSKSSLDEVSRVRPSFIYVLILVLLFAAVIIPSLFYILHCFEKTTYIDRNLDYLVHTKPYPPNFYNENAKFVPKSLPFPPKPNYNQCKLVVNSERFDCFPEDNANPKDCESRGCCWVPAEDKPTNLSIPLYTPYCFYPPDYQTYNYLNVTQTAFGLVAFLRRSYRTAYPLDSEFIKLTAKFETDTRLHVKVTDPLVNRFEPPYPEVPIVDSAALNVSYQFYIDSTTSGFQVIRKSDNTVIFDTLTLTNLIFSDQFLQISAKLPSNYIYGIGEHRDRFLLSTNWSRFTLWNHDGIPSFNRNLYGTHPFYLAMEESGNSHGVFLLNSNAMDIILQPTPAITFRPTGGVLDLYFFLGPTPRDVVSQYTELIGRPYMPPYWGLGFHLCRFGYKTLNDTKKVMQRNINAGIPLDTQWNDLDYMKNGNDFTLDTVNYKGLPEFVDELHANGMHYIPLIDPGVSGSEPPGSYPPYDEGVLMNIFVKNSTGQIFIGKVWNGVSTVWPDFTNPTTVDYWTLMLRSLHDKVKFDGAWIDMNEPSNFLSGSFNGCPKSELENPPYLPAVDGGVLNFKTMCMTSRHYAGLHYNIHNLYGLTEAIITSFALSEIRGKRPMVISRATFAGHGHYAGHWSGDVRSEWLDMEYTVPQLLSFSLYGIPLMGADICGFNGNTTRSLCNRWQQLGAFYPFSRNHNTDDGLPQDPVAMGPEVVASTKKALNIRYSLLPYLYTLFWKAHVKGETVSRPLLFEFPSDKGTYSVDTQFLWGPALMIIPVLEENATSVTAYLPKGIWYDYYTKSAITSEGINVKLSAPLDTIPLLIRGGFILPWQQPEQTTTKTRLNQINLLIASDAQETSWGDLYWDDGDSLNSYEEKRFSLITFEMLKGILRSEVVFWGPEYPTNLESVTILGIADPVSEVVVNNVIQTFTYDTIHKFLVIEKLNVSLKIPFYISWK